jgi:hypothetical protein
MGGQKEGGKSLKMEFPGRSAARCRGRADFGRTHPAGLSKAAGSEINRDWPGGFATARPRGRGKDNQRPGVPRCGGWFPGCDPRSSRV